VSCDHSPQPTPRRHPLAVTSLVVALLGIPLFGLLTGAVAAILAGVALGQIAANPWFRGRGLAIAAIAVGIADMVLWIGIIGVILPRVNRTEGPAVKQSVSPSFRAPAHVPEYVRGAMEANVFLIVEKPRRLPFLGTDSFSGSGVVLGKQGNESLILTNRHVIDPYFVADDPGFTAGPATITAYFHDGSRSMAYVLWVDPHGTDLALAATGKNPGAIPVPPTTIAREAQIGDKVFAVGNPHELSWSYAEGVVYGTRELPQGATSLRVLQIQVPINQGNSGGGLYSMDGTLIGIVSWTKSKAQAEGISFAIRYEDFARLYGPTRSNTAAPDGPQ
jgi:S1-C subfamily serine protease